MKQDHDPHAPDEQQRAALSAWMDGEPPEGGVDACLLWRQTADARADWHAYHLIGDLMRSDEHRGDAQRDARLLARVREQLAREPAILAPAPLASSRPAALLRARRRWLAPAAVAAGFVAVAGVAMVLQGGLPGGGPAAVDLAAGRGPAGAVPVAVGTPAATPNQARTVAPETMTMVRNPELDRYLAAHRQFGPVTAVPAGAVRAATVVEGR